MAPSADQAAASASRPTDATGATSAPLRSRPISLAQPVMSSGDPRSTSGWTTLLTDHSKTLSWVPDTRMRASKPSRVRRALPWTADVGLDVRGSQSRGDDAGDLRRGAGT